MSDHYLTIGAAGTAEFTDRGSRFIGCALPLESEEAFRAERKRMRAAHPKAAHVAYAFRLGADGSHSRSSDDGEPAGSAGRPILGVLESTGITDVGLFVVRYFGGTLLGVPGLINAYRSAASFALQVALLRQKERRTLYRLEFDYGLMAAVSMLLHRWRAQAVKRDNGLFCSWQIEVPLSDATAFGEDCSRMYGLTFMPVA